jgi:predicted GIY-YIG superfamily endonuclease
VIIIHSEAHQDEQAAIARERQLETRSHLKKDALINGDLEHLKALSKNRD